MKTKHASRKKFFFYIQLKCSEICTKEIKRKEGSMLMYIYWDASKRIIYVVKGGGGVLTRHVWLSELCVCTHKGGVGDFLLWISREREKSRGRGGNCWGCCWTRKYITGEKKRNDKKKKNPFAVSSMWMRASERECVLFHLFFSLMKESKRDDTYSCRFFPLPCHIFFSFLHFPPFLHLIFPSIFGVSLSFSIVPF